MTREQSAQWWSNNIGDKGYGVVGNSLSQTLETQYIYYSLHPLFLWGELCSEQELPNPNNA